MKTFSSLGNSYSLSFFVIYLHFSLLSFLAILEGQGTSVIDLSRKKLKTVHFLSYWPFCQPPNQTSPPLSQRIMRKPVLDVEQQLCPYWENCQSFLVSDPLYKVPSSSAFEIYTLTRFHIWQRFAVFKTFKYILSLEYYPHCRPRLLGQILSAVFCTWGSRINKVKLLA